MKRGRKPSDLPTRFWALVDRRGDEECWPWLGAKNTRGYGKFAVGAQRVPAYRVAYGLLVGIIGQGMELDHLCANPSCVNPAHLEQVTHRENVLRGTSPAAVHARKTHCPKGHEFTAENTGRDGDQRTCRTCRREQDAAYKARKRLAENETSPVVEEGQS